MTAVPDRRGRSSGVGAVPGQGTRSLCGGRRQGRHGGPVGPRGAPCPDCAWRADRQPNAADPPPPGTLPSLGASPTVRPCGRLTALGARSFLPGAAHPRWGSSRGSGLRLRGCSGLPFVGRRGSLQRVAGPGECRPAVSAGRRRGAAELGVPVGNRRSARLEGRAGESVRDDDPWDLAGGPGQALVRGVARGRGQPERGAGCSSSLHLGPGRRAGRQAGVRARTAATGPRPTWPVPGRPWGDVSPLRGRWAPG